MRSLACLQADSLKMRLVCLEYVSQLEHRVLAVTETYNQYTDGRVITDQERWLSSIASLIKASGREVHEIAIMPFRRVQDDRLIESHPMHRPDGQVIKSLYPQMHSLPVGHFNLPLEQKQSGHLVCVLAHNRVEIEWWAEGRCCGRVGLDYGIRLASHDIEQVVGLSPEASVEALSQVDLMHGSDLVSRVVRARIEEIFEYILDVLKSDIDPRIGLSLAGEGASIKGIEELAALAFGREGRIISLSLKGQWPRKYPEWAEVGSFIRQIIAQNATTLHSTNKGVPKKRTVQRIRELFGNYF